MAVSGRVFTHSLNVAAVNGNDGTAYDVTNFADLDFQVSGLGAGSLLIQGSMDNINYNNIAFQITDNSFTITTNVWCLTNAKSVKFVRVHTTTYAGTPVVMMSARSVDF